MLIRNIFPWVLEGRYQSRHVVVVLDVPYFLEQALQVSASGTYLAGSPYTLSLQRIRSAHTCVGFNPHVLTGNINAHLPDVFPVQSLDHSDDVVSLGDSLMFGEEQEKEFTVNIWEKLAMECFSRAGSRYAAKHASSLTSMRRVHKSTPVEG